MEPKSLLDALDGVGAVDLHLDDLVREGLHIHIHRPRRELDDVNLSVNSGEKGGRGVVFPLGFDTESQVQ